MTKPELQELKEKIELEVSTYTIDFVNEYDDLTNLSYINDSINEFADSNTSIYYSEQREFYNNHSDLCDNALLDYGYELKELLKDGSLNDAICKAGAIGEYHYICDSIYADEENVYKLYVINYCIQESISIDEELIDEIANECLYKCSRFYDILCAIEEAQESEDQE